MQKIKSLLKLAWWLAVIVYIAIFLSGNIGSVGLIAQQLSIIQISTALLSILTGKILLTFIMQQSLSHHKVDFSFIKCFHVYNITQLGKYIPGSIWQFVGRVGLYKEAGIANLTIRDSILLETFWVLASAGLMGFILTLISGRQMLQELNGYLPDYSVLILMLSLALGYVVTISTSWGRRLQSYLLRLRFTPMSAISSAFVWILLGISFWVTLLPFASDQVTLTYIIGLFALSYAIGFVVPFAPAGLGIREAILVIGLLHTLDKETSIVLASLNRVFYIFIEILLASLATALNKKPLRQT